MSNEHPRIHMNSSEFKKRCSWQVRFWITVFTFFDLLLCVVIFACVGVIVLLVFGFSSCAGLALPKAIHFHCCKTCFFLVWVCLKMRWPCFPSTWPFWGQKRTLHFETYPFAHILFWTCVFVASMLCWLAPSKTYPTEIYRFTLAHCFTLAQKITSDPHISKESDIHHSQNNEETFGKTICQKTCNSKKTKGNKYGKRLCL